MPDVREEFEVWALTNHYTPGHKGPKGEYLMGATAIAWEAWQASRAALKVELPEPHDAKRPGSLGFNACLRRVTEALQQAGIEVKP